jgi:hypothetical protein
VTLTVINALGQVVRRLSNEERKAGYHEVEFDATGCAWGVYFYRLHAGDYVATKKLVLMTLTLSHGLAGNVKMLYRCSQKLQSWYGCGLVIPAW